MEWEAKKGVAIDGNASSALIRA